jgi:hypothetical protein
MIFSDDVSEVDAIDEGTEYCEDCVEPREGGSESAKDATSNDCCCNGADATDNCLFGMDKTNWGKVKFLHMSGADGKIF